MLTVGAHISSFLVYIVNGNPTHSQTTQLTVKLILVNCSSTLYVFANTQALWQSELLMPIVTLNKCASEMQYLNIDMYTLNTILKWSYRTNMEEYILRKNIVC